MIKPIIGLEIHLQLNTRSKVFCGCSADIWEAEPNTHVCPVCLGLPGAMPVLNKTAFEYALKMALALDCTLNEETYFERKNYFYPDLPKGFQISQKRAPLGRNGHLQINGEKIGVWEVHLEEDTAKSLHTGSATFLDFNKSGLPLLEIVSAPCICSVETLDAYAKEIREIARAIKISDCDMEKGEMRFEANVSVTQQDSLLASQQEKGTRKEVATFTSRKEEHGLKSATIKEEGSGEPAEQELTVGEPGKGKSQALGPVLKPGFEELPGYRVEIKNLNSFKYLRDAVAYEIERQTELLKKGKIPPQETRGWDTEKGKTFIQRSKEEAHDYRYFPEPDLPKIRLTANGEPLSAGKVNVKKLKEELPELPGERRARYKTRGLSEEQTRIIAGDKKRRNYFETVLAGDFSKEEVSELARLIINQPEVMERQPEEVLRELKREAKEVIFSEDELSKIAEKVARENPQPVEDYRSGKKEALQFLIGQVMRKTQGKADPQIAARVLEKLLK